MSRSTTRRSVLAGAACGLAVPALLGTGTPAAFAGTRSAQPGAPGVGDEVFPNLGNGGYRANAYLVDLTYSATTRTVTGRVTMTANATQDLSRFNLDSAYLTINAVRVNKQPAVFGLSGEELTITPVKPLRNGGFFVVEVDYAVDPRQVPKPPIGGWVPTEDGFAIAPQPSGAHTIFPCNDHPSNKAHFVVRITAPTGTTGVASGHKVKETANADGSVTTLWESREPNATEILQATVGDYTIVEHGVFDGVRLRDVVPTTRLEGLRPALELTPGHLAWITQHLGEFPFEAYGLLPANTDDPTAFDFTGLETQTLTIYKPNYLLQAEPTIAPHMVHEITHNWFGNSVSPADWSSLWINEGHANYYSFLYRFEHGWPDSTGSATMIDRMKYAYRLGDIWRSTSGPVAGPNAANLWDAQRYTGGTLVLYALGQLVGEETFMRTELAFLHEFKNQSASTEDFIDVAVAVAGDASVRPFLEDWVYDTTTPPMPNHPDWVVDPVPPTLTPAQRASLRTERSHH
ncbi:M1 family metallopeptidase [Flindersiella endophytica]